MRRTIMRPIHRRHRTMKFYRAISQSLKTTLLATLVVSSGSIALAEKEETPMTESMTAYVLKQLNLREQDAYERYEKATTESDIERIKAELQSILDGYERIISESPTYTPAYVSYGMMLHRIGERKASVTMFLKADELDPLLPIVKNQLGNFQAEDGKYNEALGFFILARDLAPEEPLYHYQIGNLLVGFRKFFIDDLIFNEREIDEQIQESFRNAAMLAPANKQYRLRHAQSFFDIANPRWDRALDEWHQMQDLAEDDFEKQLFLLYTARVRFELEHVNAAKKLLKRIDHPNLDNSKQELLELIESAEI